MESGKTAVVIIIIAMLITSGVGFFLNFDKQTVTRTEYTPIGNMDALMSANSDRTHESELYNSTYNVTNWKVYDSGTNQWIPNPDIVRLPSGQANSYIITGELIDSDPIVDIYDVESHGTLVRDSWNFVGSNTSGFKTAWAGVVWNPNVSDHLSLVTNQTSDVVGPIVGGYGQQYYMIQQPAGSDIWYWDRVFIKLNGDIVVSYDDGNQMNYTPLNNIISNPVSNLPNVYYTLEFNTDVQFIVNYSLSYNSDSKWVGNDRRYNDHYINIDGEVLSDVKYLQFEFATQKWTAYNSNNLRIGSYFLSQILAYSMEFTQFEYTFTKYTVQNPTYADPTKYVPIDETSIWTNYDMDLSDPLNPHTTFVNTEVSILVKGTGTIDIGGIANQPTNYNILSAVTITKSGSMYVVNGVSIGDYLGLRITLSALTNSITVEGIVTDNSPVVDGGSGGANTPTYNYELSGVPITVPHSYTMPDLYRMRFTPGTDMQAYIENTYILSDPNQVLWKDIDIDIGSYFPDDKSHLRLLLQGFVRYGEKIYINELLPSTDNGYDVVDGKFTITQSVPGSTTAKRVTFTLNGTAIDFYNGHVYVVQTNGKAQVDLGPIHTYAIKMTGVWYFSTTASTISVYQGEEHVWTPGWTMDLNTTILTFVGVIFGSLVIMAMRFRDEMEVMDVIVLILTMIISLSLLVIS